MGLATQVVADREGNRVVVDGIGATTSIALTATNGNPAITQIGFRATQNSEAVSGVQKIKAAAEVTGLVGRLSADALINVTVNGGAVVPVIIEADDAASNRNILDVVADVQRAFDAEGFEDRIVVSSSGKRLVIKAVDDTITSFSITAPGTASSELGLPASATGSSAELRITTRDGQVHNIGLDDSNGGNHTLGDVISAIQTGTGGRVTVDFTDNDTRLRLTDHSSGGSLFKVDNAFGSTAAFLFGILAVDTTDAATDPADGIIESGQLGGVNILDRLFVQDANAHIDFSIDGAILAGAKFGFVGIQAAGGGNLGASLSIDLKDPGTSAADGRITLKELVDNLDEITTIINPPALTLLNASDPTKNRFDLAVSLTPAFNAIGLGTSPTVSIIVHDLGNPFASTPVAANIEIQTSGFEDLGHFSDIGFTDIITALRALAGFLGQFQEFGFLDQDLPLVDISINDLLSFAGDFASALDQVESNPAGTVQFLESKLKEAFNLPQDSTLFGLELVDDGTSHILRFNLNFSPSFSRSLPISLALPGPEGLIDLSGNAACARAASSICRSLSVSIWRSRPTSGCSKTPASRAVCSRPQRTSSSLLRSAVSARACATAPHRSAATSVWDSTALP